jgi:acid phosphatase (class A)
MRIASLVSRSVLLSALPFLLSSQDAARARQSGYLTAAAMPDLIRVLPSAPEPGSGRDAADRAIFKATRSLQDSPRWKLAQSDDMLSVAALLADFQCSMSLGAKPESAPVLVGMLARVSMDAGSATGPAKDFFHRKRPFLVDQGRVCIAISPFFEKTFDYPSGHATLGWAVGLILAELEPDHATAILTRARSFGESRVVCGVHNASAVEAGRTAGSALVAALNGNAAFHLDLEKARAELAVLRAKPSSTGVGCASEMSLIAKSPY